MSDPTYPNARVCEHGSLRRSCAICELEAEVEALRAERDNAWKQSERIVEANLRSMSRATAAEARVATLETFLLRLYDEANTVPLSPGGADAQDYITHAEARVATLEAALREIAVWTHARARAALGEQDIPTESSCRHAIPLGQQTGPSRCERPAGHDGMHVTTIEWWDPPRESAAARAALGDQEPT